MRPLGWLTETGTALLVHGAAASQYLLHTSAPISQLRPPSFPSSNLHLSSLTVFLPSTRRTQLGLGLERRIDRGRDLRDPQIHQSPTAHAFSTADDLNLASAKMPLCGGTKTVSRKLVLL